MGIPLELLGEVREQTNLVTVCPAYSEAQDSESGRLAVATYAEVVSCLPARLLIPQVPVTADAAPPALGLCGELLLFSALQKEPPGCLDPLPLGGEV